MLNTTPIAMTLDTIEDKYPLSFIQQRMLFNSLYAPKSESNIEQLICALQENINISVFKQAWQRVLERHSILRTSFCWEGVTEPLQKVQRQVIVPFEEQDWRDLSTTQQEQQLQSYLQADRQRGFQLSEPPLMRVALFHLAQSHYQLVWTFHPILLDSQSFPIVLKEVFAFYEAFSSNQDLQLPQPRPYRDYIDWLRKQDFSKVEQFWRNTLSGFRASTPLTVDSVQKSAKEERYWYGQQEIRFSQDLTCKLKFLTEQHQLTFNALIQAAWALVLSRYSGEEDVVFGATRACRQSALEEADSMVGCFNNTLPIRVRVSHEMPLLQWLKDLQSQWIALRDYKHTPLTKIQDWSDIPAGQPLFESLLVVENHQLNSQLREQGGNWENREFRLLERTSYPLTVAGYLESEFLLQIEYDRGRFDDATIARMLGHIQTLLEGMVANPEQLLKDLPLLTAAERHQLLVEWNNTFADYPKDSCYHHLFEAQVEQTPDAVAVVFGDKQLTYRELNTRANQLAHYLQALGVKPDVLVAISVERSLEMVVGFLGILKAGGAYVPIDPAYPHERRAYQLKDSQTPVILTQERLVASLPENNAQVVRLDSDWEVIAQQSQENLVSETTAQNLAYVIYTSGSTGKPKGVMITHQGLVNHNLAIARQYDLEGSVSAHRVLQFSSMSFDIIIEELFPSWLIGATVILRPEDILSSTRAFWQFVEREQVTILNVPTAFWHELVKGLSLVKEPLPACVHLVVVGGEKASRSAYMTWRQLVGKYPRWINAYGPTETTVTATVYDPATDPESDRSLLEIPIGRPIANAQAYILDRHLQPVPIGVPGELHIGGSGVGRGYLNRPDLTAIKFIRNPFSNDPEARLYKTGDSVRYLPNGNIEFIGRIDFQVKIRGFRIELIEIEGALEQHSFVQQAVVLAREDVPGRKQLVAYLVLKPDEKLTTSELRSFLKEKLPDYMIPSAFVMLESLPLTPNGKVDRRAMPAPDATRIESEKTVVKPRNPVEFQLARIWEEILGVSPIGVTDNFMELGGHSLLVMRLVTQINNVFGINLPLATIFEAPTIEQLAKLLDQEVWSTPWRSLITIQPEGDKPPFFCVHDVIGNAIFCQRWVHLLPNQPLYGLQPQGMNGKQAPFTRVEDMAAHYIKEIQTIQPNGPYFIGGYSLGGFLAFEMAQQLHAQGQQVALVALFDAQGPGFRKRMPLRWLRYQVNQVLQHGLTYIGKQLKLKQTKHRLESDLSHFTQNLALNRETSSDDYILRILEANLTAEENYLPQRYPGKVSLFRAMHERAREGYYLDRELGWGKLAAKGVDIYEVASNHDDMMKEPYVQLVAEQLRICLDKEQAAISPPH